MKLIKKIAAMLFAFAMVFSMGTNVKAEGTGKITISPANPNEEYKIYKILKLESYDETKKLYSYTKTGDKWDDFIDSAVLDGYLTINTDGYVTFSTTKNSPEDVREFARKALAYATTNNITATSTKTTGANDDSATIDGLDLGYYLVGSTVGALCSLDTTNPEVTVRDKNEAPTVEKKIVQGEKLVDKNSANIGEEVIFQTTIYVKPGAKNYVLHDIMDPHLQYGGILQVHDNLHNLADTTDFVVKTIGTDGREFEISFTDAYYAKNRENIDTGKLNKITVQYGVYVKDDAVINQPMINRTHLTYGDEDTKTNESETTTKTFGIPVFKYTGNNEALAGAKFILSTDPDCEESTAIKFTRNSEDKYRYDKTGTATLESLSTGRIDIEGLKAGTYYLKETKAPDRYNLLKKIQKIEIGEDGSIKLNGDVITGDVKVKNNSGIELPSTGGMGTTLIYLAGIVLVVLSGYVLISKRRASTK